MSYEEQLDEERLRLQKLQLNIQTSNLNKVIEELREKWKPETKEVEGWKHGGESVHERVFYNPFTETWTTKHLAFRGFVLDEISKKL